MHFGASMLCVLFEHCSPSFGFAQPAKIFKIKSTPLTEQSRNGLIAARRGLNRVHASDRSKFSNK